MNQSHQTLVVYEEIPNFVTERRANQNKTLRYSKFITGKGWMTHAHVILIIEAGPGRGRGIQISEHF